MCTPAGVRVPARLRDEAQWRFGKPIQLITRRKILCNPFQFIGVSLVFNVSVKNCTAQYKICSSSPSPKIESNFWACTHGLDWIQKHL